MSEKRVSDFPYSPLSSDKFHDECGVFGIFNHPEAANLTYLGLHALQHRGQEGAGLCSSDRRQLFVEKSVGLVADIFSEKRLKRLPGDMAIGHTRYSTAGASALKNVQPIMVNFSLGSLAIGHNGNLVNAVQLRSELESEGAIFQSTSDSEVIVHLIANSKAGGLYERIIDALRKLQGAYSLLMMTENEMIAVRDPYGFRPLSIGLHDGAYVVASETCAFDLIGAKYLQDVAPGEMIIINEKGLQSMKPFYSKRHSFCFGNQSVNEIRKELGRQLARENAIDADLVIPVPDSGVPAALGYAEESGIPFDYGLIRNHYVGRTFIEPKQTIRHFGVKLKLNPVRQLLYNKRVIVIDDSIVRGTTSKKIIKMLKEGGGAREVHMRISSPPTIGPCFYGIDTPTRKELIAATHSVEEIRKYITSESLRYLSLEGLLQVVPSPEQYCTACFDNQYPILTAEDISEQIALFY
jgi:amidophosphoribosyltransferase